MKYIYMLRAGDNHYKIGIAFNVRKRVQSIQTSNANPIQIITTKLVAEPRKVEDSIHKSLHEAKLNGGTEWFKLTSEQALDLAALINTNPEVDITEQLTLKDLVRRQLSLEKDIHKKLDAVLQPAYKQSDPISSKKTVEFKKIPQKPTLEEDVEKAIEVIKKTGRASTSHLQVMLSFGFGRATRVINELERRGNIGPPDGIKPRKLYI